MKNRVKLGDEVQDRVTGFRGIATSMTLFLNGCTRIGVQPRLDKDGKIPDTAGFDEPQLEIIKVGAVKSENQDIIEERVERPKAKTGGPMIRPMQQNLIPKRR